MNQPFEKVLKERGVVVAIEGDNVFVETQRSTGCSGCSSESGCGTSALSKLFSNTGRAPLKVKSDLKCVVGDSVELALDESRLLQHSFMAYGLPLIGLFLFAIVFSKLASGFAVSPGLVDLFSIIGGGLGLFAGWWLTRRVYKPVLPEITQVFTHNGSAI